MTQNCAKKIQHWKPFCYPCHTCGAKAVTVLTDMPEGMFGDQDLAKCSACGKQGTVQVADPESVYITWDGEEE